MSKAAYKADSQQPVGETGPTLMGTEASHVYMDVEPTMELGAEAAQAVETLDASVVIAPDIGTEKPEGAVKSTPTVALTLAVPSPLGTMLVKLTLVAPKLK